MLRKPILRDSSWLALQELEGLTPADPAMALVHVRAMFQRLSEMATAAAEERWPGFEDLVQRLMAKELELQGQAVNA